MEINTLESFANIILVLHSIILFPIAKYIFVTEKRLTRIETKLEDD